MNGTKKSNVWLVFIDTNIFLDFYRLPGEGAKRQLEALKRHQDSLILSEQVRMEFLKNRQKAILDGMTTLKEPQPPQIPPILADYDSVKTLKSLISDARDCYKEVQSQLSDILEDPKSHDPVFQDLEKIFKKNGPLILDKKTKERDDIIQHAERRFKLGFPPRKSNDTSIGDAVNWEWLVHCAVKGNDGKNILIVSRDGDYGTFKKKEYLNDWLHHEFHERVGIRREVKLTNKLTTALKLLDEHVAPEDLAAEEALITNDKKYGRPKPYGASAFLNLDENKSNEELKMFLGNWKADGE